MQQFYWFSINKASSHFFQTSSLFPATSSKAISTRTSCQSPPVQASHLALPLQTCCSSWPLKNGNPFQKIKIKIKMQREKPTSPTKTSFSSWCEAQQRCYPVPQPTSASPCSTHTSSLARCLNTPPALPAVRCEVSLPQHPQSIWVRPCPPQCSQTSPNQISAPMLRRCGPKETISSITWEIFVHFVQPRGLRSISGGLVPKGSLIRTCKSPRFGLEPAAKQQVRASCTTTSQRPGEALTSLNDWRLGYSVIMNYIINCPGIPSLLC